jgi:hypothetical protein
LTKTGNLYKIYIIFLVRVYRALFLVMKPEILRKKSRTWILQKPLDLKSAKERIEIKCRMKHRNYILLSILTVGLSCTAAERGVVIKETGPAIQHTAANDTGSPPQKALSPSVPDVSGKQHSEYWTIDYAVSGGFAGIRRLLNLSGNGRIVASDLKRKRRVEQQASSEQLVKIADALSMIDFSRLQATGPKLSSRCADCFQHELTVVKDGQHHKLYFDDTTLKDPACAELISLLSSILNQALVKQGP